MKNQKNKSMAIFIVMLFIGSTFAHADHHEEPVDWNTANPNSVDREQLKDALYTGKVPSTQYSMITDWSDIDLTQVQSPEMIPEEHVLKDEQYRSNQEFLNKLSAQQLAHNIAEIDLSLIESELLVNTLKEINPNVPSSMNIFLPPGTKYSGGSLIIEGCINAQEECRLNLGKINEKTVSITGGVNTAGEGHFTLINADGTYTTIINGETVEFHIKDGELVGYNVDGHIVSGSGNIRKTADGYEITFGDSNLKIVPHEDSISISMEPYGVSVEGASKIGDKVQGMAFELTIHKFGSARITQTDDGVQFEGVKANLKIGKDEYDGTFSTTYKDGVAQEFHLQERGSWARLGTTDGKYLRYRVIDNDIPGFNDPKTVEKNRIIDDMILVLIENPELEKIDIPKLKELLGSGAKITEKNYAEYIRKLQKEKADLLAGSGSAVYFSSGPDGTEQKTATIGKMEIMVSADKNCERDTSEIWIETKHQRSMTVLRQPNTERKVLNLNDLITFSNTESSADIAELEFKSSIMTKSGTEKEVPLHFDIEKKDGIMGMKIDPQSIFELGAEYTLGSGIVRGLGLISDKPGSPAFFASDGITMAILAKSAEGYDKKAGIGYTKELKDAIENLRIKAALIGAQNKDTNTMTAEEIDKYVQNDKVLNALFESKTGNQAGAEKALRDIIEGKDANEKLRAYQALAGISDTEAAVKIIDEQIKYLEFLKEDGGNAAKIDAAILSAQVQQLHISCGQKKECIEGFAAEYSEAKAVYTKNLDEAAKKSAKLQALYKIINTKTDPSDPETVTIEDKIRAAQEIAKVDAIQGNRLLADLYLQKGDTAKAKEYNDKFQDSLLSNIEESGFNLEISGITLTDFSNLLGESQLTSARISYENKNYEESKSQLETTILMQNSDDAREMLARILYQEGNYKDAKNTLSKLSDPKSSEMLQRLTALEEAKTLDATAKRQQALYEAQKKYGSLTNKNTAEGEKLKNEIINQQNQIRINELYAKRDQLTKDGISTEEQKSLDTITKELESLDAWVTNRNIEAAQPTIAKIAEIDKQLADSKYKGDKQALLVEKERMLREVASRGTLGENGDIYREQQKDLLKKQTAQFLMETGKTDELLKHLEDSGLNKDTETMKQIIKNTINSGDPGTAESLVSMSGGFGALGDDSDDIKNSITELSNRQEQIKSETQDYNKILYKILGGDATEAEISRFEQKYGTAEEVVTVNGEKLSGKDLIEKGRDSIELKNRRTIKANELISNEHATTQELQEAKQLFINNGDTESAIQVQQRLIAEKKKQTDLGVFTMDSDIMNKVEYELQLLEDELVDIRRSGEIGDLTTELKYATGIAEKQKITENIASTRQKHILELDGEIDDSDGNLLTGIGKFLSGHSDVSDAQRVKDKERQKIQTQNKIDIEKAQISIYQEIDSAMQMQDPEERKNKINTLVNEKIDKGLYAQAQDVIDLAKSQGVIKNTDLDTATIQNVDDNRLIHLLNGVDYTGKDTGQRTTGVVRHDILEDLPEDQRDRIKFQMLSDSVVDANTALKKIADSENSRTETGSEWTTTYMAAFKSLGDDDKAIVNKITGFASGAFGFVARVLKDSAATVTFETWIKTTATDAQEKMDKNQAVTQKQIAVVKKLSDMSTDSQKQAIDYALGRTTQGPAELSNEEIADLKSAIIRTGGSFATEIVELSEIDRDKVKMTQYDYQETINQQAKIDSLNEHTMSSIGYKDGKYDSGITLDNNALENGVNLVGAFFGSISQIKNGLVMTYNGAVHGDYRGENVKLMSNMRQEQTSNEYILSQIEAGKSLDELKKDPKAQVGLKSNMGLMLQRDDAIDKGDMASANSFQAQVHAKNSEYHAAMEDYTTAYAEKQAQARYDPTKINELLALENDISGARIADNMGQFVEEGGNLVVGITAAGGLGRAVSTSTKLKPITSTLSKAKNVVTKPIGLTLSKLPGSKIVTTTSTKLTKNAAIKEAESLLTKLVSAEERAIVQNSINTLKTTSSKSTVNLASQEIRGMAYQNNMRTLGGQISEAIVQPYTNFYYDPILGAAKLNVGKAAKGIGEWIDEGFDTAVGETGESGKFAAGLLSRRQNTKVFNDKKDDEDKKLMDNIKKELPKYDSIKIDNNNYKIESSNKGLVLISDNNKIDIKNYEQLADPRIQFIKDGQTDYETKAEIVRNVGDMIATAKLAELADQQREIEKVTVDIQNGLVPLSVYTQELNLENPGELVGIYGSGDIPGFETAFKEATTGGAFVDGIDYSELDIESQNEIITTLHTINSKEQKAEIETKKIEAEKDLSNADLYSQYEADAINRHKEAPSAETRQEIDFFRDKKVEAQQQAETKIQEYNLDIAHTAEQDIISANRQAEIVADKIAEIKSIPNPSNRENNEKQALEEQLIIHESSVLNQIALIKQTDLEIAKSELKQLKITAKEQVRVNDMAGFDQTFNEIISKEKEIIDIQNKANEATIQKEEKTIDVLQAQTNVKESTISDMIADSIIRINIAKDNMKSEPVAEEITEDSDIDKQKIIELSKEEARGFIEERGDTEIIENPENIDSMPITAQSKKMLHACVKETVALGSNRIVAPSTLADLGIVSPIIKDMYAFNFIEDGKINEEILQDSVANAEMQFYVKEKLNEYLTSLKQQSTIESLEAILGRFSSQIANGFAPYSVSTEEMIASLEQKYVSLMQNSGPTVYAQTKRKLSVLEDYKRRISDRKDIVRVSTQEMRDSVYVNKIAGIDDKKRMYEDIGAIVNGKTPSYRTNDPSGSTAKLYYKTGKSYKVIFDYGDGRQQIASIDIHDFKHQMNTRYGHSGGNRYIKETAKALEEVLSKWNGYNPGAFMNERILSNKFRENVIDSVGPMTMVGTAEHLKGTVDEEYTLGTDEYNMYIGLSEVGTINSIEDAQALSDHASDMGKTAQLRDIAGISKEAIEDLIHKPREEQKAQIDLLKTQKASALIQYSALNDGYCCEDIADRRLGEDRRKTVQETEAETRERQRREIEEARKKSDAIMINEYSRFGEKIIFRDLDQNLIDLEKGDLEVQDVLYKAMLTDPDFGNHLTGEIPFLNLFREGLRTKGKKNFAKTFKIGGDELGFVVSKNGKVTVGRIDINNFGSFGMRFNNEDADKLLWNILDIVDSNIKYDASEAELGKNINNDIIKHLESLPYAEEIFYDQSSVPIITLGTGTIETGFDRVDPVLFNQILDERTEEQKEEAKTSIISSIKLPENVQPEQRIMIVKEKVLAAVNAGLLQASDIPAYGQPNEIFFTPMEKNRINWMLGEHDADLYGTIESGGFFTSDDTTEQTSLKQEAVDLEKRISDLKKAAPYEDQNLDILLAYDALETVVIELKSSEDTSRNYDEWLSDIEQDKADLSKQPVVEETKSNIPAWTKTLLSAALIPIAGPAALGIIGDVTTVAREPTAIIEQAPVQQRLLSELIDGLTTEAVAADLQTGINQKNLDWVENKLTELGENVQEDAILKGTALNEQLLAWSPQDPGDITLRNEAEKLLSNLPTSVSKITMERVLEKLQGAPVQLSNEEYTVLSAFARIESNKQRWQKLRMMELIDEIGSHEVAEEEYTKEQVDANIVGGLLVTTNSIEKKIESSEFEKHLGDYIEASMLYKKTGDFDLTQNNILDVWELMNIDREMTWLEMKYVLKLESMKTTYSKLTLIALKNKFGGWDKVYEFMDIRQQTEPGQEVQSSDAAINKEINVPKENIAIKVKPAPVVKNARYVAMEEVARSTLDTYLPLEQSSKWPKVLNKDFMIAIQYAESKYDPKAKSKAGGISTMQVTKIAVNDVLRILKKPQISDKDWPFMREVILDNADYSRAFGKMYLYYIVTHYKITDPDMIRAAYNAGQDIVRRLGRVPNYPETKFYISENNNAYKAVGDIRKLLGSNGMDSTWDAPMPFVLKHMFSVTNPAGQQQLMEEAVDKIKQKAGNKKTIEYNELQELFGRAETETTVANLEYFDEIAQLTESENTFLTSNNLQNTCSACLDLIGQIRSLINQDRINDARTVLQEHIEGNQIVFNTEKGVIEASDGRYIPAIESFEAVIQLLDAYENANPDAKNVAEFRSDINSYMETIREIEQGEIATTDTLEDKIIIEKATKTGSTVEEVNDNLERSIKAAHKAMEIEGFIGKDYAQNDPVAEMLYNVHSKFVDLIKKDYPDFESQFHLVDNNDVNAFVFSKHQDVYFSKGLYEEIINTANNMKSLGSQIKVTEDMLAYIIAHELSHSIQHTNTKGLEDSDFKIENLPYIVQMRKNAEYDADSHALNLIDEAGYSVFGALDMLSVFHFMGEESGVETLLDSHPYTKDRYYRAADKIISPEVQIFPNAKNEQKELTLPEKISSKHADFELLLRDDADIIKQAEEAQTFHQAKELLNIYATKVKMQNLKSVKNNAQAKEIFAKRMYLDAAVTALEAVNEYELDTVNRHSLLLRTPANRFKTLRMAGAANEYSEDQTNFEPDIELLTTKSFKGRDAKEIESESLNTYVSNRVNELRNDISTIDDKSEKKKVTKSLNKINKYLQIIQQEMSKIDDSFVDDVAKINPDSVEDYGDIADRFLGNYIEVTEKKFGKIDTILTNPKELVAGYLYRNYIGQASSTIISGSSPQAVLPNMPVDIRKNIEGIDFQSKIEKQDKHIYLQDPKISPVDTFEQRRELLDTLIISYYADSTKDSNKDPAPKPNEILLDIDFNSEYDPVLKSIHSALVRTSHELTDNILERNNMADNLLTSYTGIEFENTGIATKTDIEQLMMGSIQPSEKFTAETDLTFHKSHQLTQELTDIDILDSISQEVLDTVFEKDPDRFNSYLTQVMSDNKYIEENKENLLHLIQKIPIDFRKEIVGPVHIELLYGRDSDSLIRGFHDVFGDRLGLEKLESYLREMEIKPNMQSLTITQGKIAEYLLTKSSAEYIPDLYTHGVFMEYSTAQYLGEDLQTLYRQQSEGVIDADQFTYRKSELMNEKLSTDDVFRTMSFVAPLTTMSIRAPYVTDVDKTGTNDFRTGKSRKDILLGKYIYARYSDLFLKKSNLVDHNFGFATEDVQSPYLLKLMDMDISQLQELLKSSQSAHDKMRKLEYEYRGADSYMIRHNDFSNVLQAIILQKLAEKHDPTTSKITADTQSLEKIFDIRVEYRKTFGGTYRVFPNINLHIDNSKINSIPADEFISTFKDTVPSTFMDDVVEEYVVKNNLYHRYPEFKHMLLDTNNLDRAQQQIDNTAESSRAWWKIIKTPYNQKLVEALDISSPRTRLFGKYEQSLGDNGYIEGFSADNLDEVNDMLPDRSLFRDQIYDMWESSLIPEYEDNLLSRTQKIMIGGMSILKKIPLLNRFGFVKNSPTDLLKSIKAFDADIDKIKKIDDISIADDKIESILDFYEAIIPHTFSTQRQARYGATAFLLWEKSSLSADANFQERFNKLIHFMPEPSILRDEMLINLVDKQSDSYNDMEMVVKELYQNHLLDTRKDYRTHDFVTENIASMFSVATRADRAEVLLWVQGAGKKPKFVKSLEKKNSISFKSLPRDLKLMPQSLRDQFISSFMLGDNGLLDPLSTKQGTERGISDEEVMENYLKNTFLDLIPKRLAKRQGIEPETRMVLADMFVVLMKEYPPYRRVEIMNDLADLYSDKDFKKKSIGERLSVLLGALGPVGIKTAQYLSENEVLIPNAELRSSLGSLRNEAPPFSKVAAYGVLADEIPDYENRVVTLDDTVGVASIKQVYAGQWKSDQIYDVVYKIRRPALTILSPQDYQALDVVIDAINNRKINNKIIDMGDASETIKRWIETEMNFDNEVRFHDDISKSTYTSPYEVSSGLYLKDPEIHFSTEAVIVEDRIKGVAIKDLYADEFSVQDMVEGGYQGLEAEVAFSQLQEFKYEDIRNILRDNLLHQIFTEGVFHADLHQGNVMVNPDGIYMIDRGNVGYLDDIQRQGAKQVIKGVLLKDTVMIKNGIDSILAQKGESSSISEADIKKILDNSNDIKNSINNIVLRVVKDGRGQGADDFATFMKAFTQAMYLFPSDIENGAESLGIMAAHLDLSDSEIMTAVKIQARNIALTYAETISSSGFDITRPVIKIIVNPLAKIISANANSMHDTAFKQAVETRDFRLNNVDPSENDVELRVAALTEDLRGAYDADNFAVANDVALKIQPKIDAWAENFHVTSTDELADVAGYKVEFVENLDDISKAVPDSEWMIQIDKARLDAVLEGLTGKEKNQELKIILGHELAEILARNEKPDISVADAHTAALFIEETLGEPVFIDSIEVKTVEASNLNNVLQQNGIFLKENILEMIDDIGNPQTIHELREKLLTTNNPEFQNLLSQAENLHTQLYPVTGFSTFDPVQFYQNNDPYTIIELAKIYSRNNKQKEDLNRLKNELGLYLLPVETGEKYHVSLLSDLQSIVTSQKLKMSTIKSLSGQGVYYFESLEDGRLATYQPKAGVSGDHDYPVVVYRDKTNSPPVIIQVYPKANEGGKILSYTDTEKFKKKGGMVARELESDEFKIYINIDTLDRQSEIYDHLELKRLIKDGKILRNDVGGGWFEVNPKVLAYQITESAYNRKDDQIMNFGKLLENDIGSIIPGVTEIQDTGSSARGYTHDNPDFDLQVATSQIVRPQEIQNEIMSGLNNRKSQLVQIYGEIQIEARAPHTVANHQLVPIVFTRNNKIVGGIDVNIHSSDNGQGYHTKATSQLGSILENVPEQDKEEVRQHIATQIKTLKKFLITTGLYKEQGYDQTITKDRFNGISVEQLILNLGEYVSTDGLSTQEIKELYSTDTVLYLLGNLENQNGNYYFKDTNFDIVGISSLLPKIGTSMQTLISYAKNHEQKKMLSVHNSFSQLPDKKKVQLLDISNDAFSKTKWKLTDRLRLADYISQNYDTDIYSTEGDKIVRLQAANMAGIAKSELGNPTQTEIVTYFESHEVAEQFEAYRDETSTNPNAILSVDDFARYYIANTVVTTPAAQIIDSGILPKGAKIESMLMHAKNPTHIDKLTKKMISNRVSYGTDDQLVTSPVSIAALADYHQGRADYTSTLTKLLIEGENPTLAAIAIDRSVNMRTIIKDNNLNEFIPAETVDWYLQKISETQVESHAARGLAIIEHLESKLVEIGFTTEEVRRLKAYYLIHDIGKLGDPRIGPEFEDLIIKTFEMRRIQSSDRVSVRFAELFGEQSQTIIDHINSFETKNSDTNHRMGPDYRMKSYFNKHSSWGRKRLEQIAPSLVDASLHHEFNTLDPKQGIIELIDTYEAGTGRLKYDGVQEIEYRVDHDQFIQIIRNYMNDMYIEYNVDEGVKEIYDDIVNVMFEHLSPEKLLILEASPRN